MTDIIECGAKGFKSVFSSDTWQIATITYDKIYSPEGFDHMKRHLGTDEVFILINGEAVLHTLEGGVLESTNIEKGKIYCVRKNTWHYLCVSKDALLAVVENKDITPDQTERMELECLLQK